MHLGPSESTHRADTMLINLQYSFYQRTVLASFAQGRSDLVADVHGWNRGGQKQQAAAAAGTEEGYRRQMSQLWAGRGVDFQESRTLMRLQCCARSRPSAGTQEIFLRSHALRPCQPLEPLLLPYCLLEPTRVPSSFSSRPRGSRPWREHGIM